MGVNPEPLTLRELLWMHEGQQRTAWDHTTWIVAKLHNVNVAKKRDRIEPGQINPYRKHKTHRDDAVVITNENVQVMRKAFTGR